MNIEELKELIKDLPDETRIFTHIINEDGDMLLEDAYPYYIILEDDWGYGVDPQSFGNMLEDNEISPFTKWEKVLMLRVQN